MSRRYLFLFLCMVIFGISFPAAAAEQNKYEYFNIIKLVIGEKEAEINYQPTTMDVAAYIKNGRTLVPFRFLGEALNAQIKWDDQKKQATLNLNGTEVKVTIGSKVAYIDGKMNVLDVPAEIKGGRTFIPLRFVSEALGAWVDFDAETQQVRVRHVNQANWKEYTQPLTELVFSLPNDWVAKEEEDYVTKFTAPTGSEMWSYAAQDKPVDALKNLKQQALDNGWTFEAESFDDPKDPQQGGMISFYKYDSIAEDYLNYFIYVDSLAENGGSFVSEQFIWDEVSEMDNVIMLAIHYS